LTEGSNLYYTTTRGNTDFDTRLATKTTSNLTEGSNLYHTADRVRSSISVSGVLSYNTSTGVIGYTGPDLSNYATTTYVNTELELKANISSLATVATSGNYNDLNNKPISISTNYITVRLRDSTTYASSSIPVLRVYPLRLRNETFLDLPVTQ
jgi:hypothetical protein